MIQHVLNTSLKKLGASVLGSMADRPNVRQTVFNALRLRRPEIMRLAGMEEMRFLAHVLERIDTSRAQILQDLWITYEMKEKRGGYFVEFGATNGLTNSNTWLLEKEFGWSGILAEPNPVWHGDLARHRNCDIDHRCVYRNSDDIVSLLAPDDAELSSISTSSEGDHFASIRRSAASIDVSTVSLNDLLDEHDAPELIDYMSIDTEGSELEILNAYDFKKRKVLFFSIEHNNTTREQEIDKLLASNGYRRRFPEFSQWDAWYLRDGL